MLRATPSVARFFLLPAVSLFSFSTVAGTCLPNRHLLGHDATERLIADAVVIGKVPSLIEGHPDSAVMRVSAVYAGAAPRRIVVDSEPPAVTSIDCPTDLSVIPNGTRLFMNIRQDAATGRFGGGFRDNYVQVDGEEVRGLLFLDDCESDDQNCLYSRQTMSLSAFEALAEPYYPGQFSRKSTVSVGSLDIGLRDGKPAPGAEIALDFETLPVCANAEPNAVRTGQEAGVLEISLRFLGSPLDITPAPPCDIGWPKVIPIGRVYETGSHVVKIYAETGNESESFFQASNLVGEIPFEVGEPSEQANPETPANGSIQSGIGLIRGWACDAISVHVQFDNLPPLELAYGTARADTLSVCGDANNGYGTVFAWGSLGEGMHTMSTWIDGEFVSSVEFEVRGLGNPFMTGLFGEYDLQNFPADGQSVTVRWSQPDQNFIITNRSE